jgi:16S rRNA (cytosine967-C5)-methyltransferase
MTASGPREIALGVLLRVTEHGGYSNLALPAALGRSRLSQADRDLATELSYGTIRRLVSLDWALEHAAERPTSEMTARARALLRLGAYQVLFTRIPGHAAVGETVELGGPREKAFVNAVLRRLSAGPPSWPSGSGDEQVGIRTGLAAWAVRELRAQLGDETEAAAAALAARAPLCLRTNTCRTRPERLELALRDAGIEPRRGIVHPTSFSIQGGSPQTLPGFRDGWFAVQDQASSFVVAAGLDPRPGERVLDACAGPGGKAAHIACLVGARGSLVAADASPKRAGLVTTALRRLGVEGLVLAQDARSPGLRGGFDAVLVDAPCSGIGSARRRPELLWRPARSELSRLARLQVVIAAGAADLVRPGGRVVYSVCTFPRAETDAACDALLAKRPDLEPIGIEGPGGSASRIRLWPHRDGTDAMFVAAFRRN